MGYLILPESGIVYFWQGWLWGFWQREAGMGAWVEEGERQWSPLYHRGIPLP